jgi:hypothetical protein
LLLLQVELLALVMLQVELLLRELMLWVRSRTLVRVELCIGGRRGVIVGVKLAGYGLRAGVDDDDVRLFKVLHESVEILKIETTASVIAALERGRSIA